MKFIIKGIFSVTLFLSTFAIANTRTLSCDNGDGLKLCEAMKSLAVSYASRCPVSEACLPILQNLLEKTVEFNGLFSQVDNRFTNYDVSIVRIATNLADTACSVQVYGPIDTIQTLGVSRQTLMDNLYDLGKKSGFYVRTCNSNIQ